MKNSTGKVPLERALSKLGVLSRSRTRAASLAGRIRVNGRIIKDSAFPVTPEKDAFALDGIPLRKSRWQTIMMYKPRGVVTTRSDEKGRPTIYDILPHELRSLHPVGRLDMASDGLLILTSDTRLSAYLTDPANAIGRTYIVTVEGKLTDKEIKIAEEGVWDKGELLKPLSLTLRKASGKESHLLMELTEGKNREIRRLFAFLKHPVRKIKRIAFGKLHLGNLQPGQFRHLTEEELGWKRKE